MIPYGGQMEKVEPERPVDVRTAFELWCAVAVLGIFASVAMVFVALGERAKFTEELTRRLAEMNPPQTVDVDLTFNIGVALAGMFGVVIAGIVFFLAWLMRAGKGWARMLLIGATAFAAVSAISSFTAQGQSGVAPMALEIIMILQAVLAVGATVLVHRRDANLYFLPRRKP